jgi:hypothetical protein
MTPIKHCGYCSDHDSCEKKLKAYEFDWMEMREKIDWAIGKCHEQDAGFQIKIINGLEKVLASLRAK